MSTISFGPDLYSVNPFLPCNEFIPDGEPRVFGERVYLYGSHDLYTKKKMCGGDYVCYSAPSDNPTKWTYEGVIFQRTQDPFVKKILDKNAGNMMNSCLFAPDVIFVDGMYYLYYGVGLSRSGFGVACSDSPIGPFEYMGRVRYPESEKPTGWRDTRDGINDGDMAFGRGVGLLSLRPGKGFGLRMDQYPYDPALLVEDGRLYLYYGFGYCRVVELDMRDKRTVLKNPETGRYESDVLVPNKFDKAMKPLLQQADSMGMNNGPSIRKIDERFFLSYYASNDEGCHALCHAVADHPLGPFSYAGRLISLGNAGYGEQKEPTAPVGNTHGGLVKLNDRWYTIYHRQTGTGMFGRQACAAALTLRDGLFEQAEYTSQGFSAHPLPAFHTWPAYMACHLATKDGKNKRSAGAPIIDLIETEGGLLDPETGKELYQVVRDLRDGGTVGFKYLDFGAQPVQAEIGVKLRTKAAGCVSVFLDQPFQGTPVARIGFTPSDKWIEYRTRFETIAGVHAVYFVFETQAKQSGEFSHFAFSHQS